MKKKILEEHGEVSGPRDVKGQMKRLACWVLGHQWWLTIDYGNGEYRQCRRCGERIVSFPATTSNTSEVGSDTWMVAHGFRPMTTEESSTAHQRGYFRCRLVNKGGAR